jgi:hypothetical protein
VADHILAEMRRLNDAGFGLLPLGGKVPLISFAGKPISLGQVAAIMSKNGSNAYGVRLHNLAVVDVDERSQELFDIVTERCGDAAVQVDTSRGRHCWFENPANIRFNFKKDRLPIDFKTGFNSFVVGPHSQRPDGGAYRPFKGILGIDPLTIIKGSSRALKTASPSMQSASDQVMEGTRNKHLVRMARRMAFTSDSEGELVDNLMYERDFWCDAGSHPVGDREVEKIAKWAWGKLQAGELWREGEQMLYVPAAPLENLTKATHGDKAALLLLVLKQKHGAERDKTFLLDHSAMKTAGLIQYGREVFQQVVRLLEQLGLIERVGRYKVKGYKQQFRLCK